MLLLSLGLSLAVAPPPGSASEAVASVLRSDVFLAACERLDTIPLLCSSSSAPAVASSSRERPALDLPPSAALLDDANCLLRAVHDSVSTHLASAIGLSHPLSELVSPGEPPDLVAAVAHVASLHPAPDGHAVNYHRHAIISLLTSVASDLRPLSAELHELMPYSVRQVAGGFNVAFLAAMVHSISWPDTSLVECFVLGFPIVGFCPLSGVPSFRPVDRPFDPPDISSLPNSAQNAVLARRMESEFAAGRARHASVLWDHTMEEVRLGLTQGPFTAADLDRRFGAGQWRSMMRFAVEQSRQDGSIKVRPCDDAAASMHNECTSLGETITCDAADFPARVAALFASYLGLDGGWDMAGGTDDIVRAYRQCPCRTPQFAVVCVVDPGSSPGRAHLRGRAFFFVLPGMNFGLVSAVNQFNRFPELVVAFLRRKCGVVCTHYFDDYCVCEPTYVGATGQVLLRTVHQLFGMPLAPDKHVPMCHPFVFLGILTDFSRFRSDLVILLRPKPGRAASVIGTIATVLAAGYITYSQASSLRGKLQFLLRTSPRGSLAARTVLWAISLVRRGGRGIPILGPVLNALRFLRAVLPYLPPRSISLISIARAATRPPVVVWSDAMWDRDRRQGGLGWVVWLPPGHPDSRGTEGHFLFGTRCRVGLEELPFLVPKDSLIGQLELLAAASPYISLPPSTFADQDVLHFVDNTSALYGMVKGYSRVPDSSAIIRAFQVANIALGANVWFNYVATKANVADLPSRGAMGEMAAALRSVLPSFSLAESERELIIPACPTDASWADVMSQLPAHHPSVGQGSSSRRSKRSGKGSKRCR